ncbi:glycogen synthase, partial [bacterium]|nr:glycogen synthase [bacterium]
MKILFLASEIAPFARTGGLADVSGALPLALAALGHDVRLAMPCYGDLRRRSAATDTGVRLPLAVAGVKQPAAILETALQGLPVYLVEQPALFDRAGLYGTPAGDYPDNPKRFAAFCQAALAMLPALGFRPEVLHGNDWQTGLAPVLLRAARRNDPFFAGCGALFTIHNLGYQGLFPATALPRLGLDPALARPEALEFWGQLSLLKGGVVFADRVNTVSPTYRRETLGPEQGYGFDGILRARGEHYSGILNGIDRQQWNPAADAALVQPYDVLALAGKAVCKTALQRELGLDERPDVPLVA